MEQPLGLRGEGGIDAAVAEAAEGARDVRELGRLTHSLKGSLAMLAAHESAELAASASGQCLETGTIPDASLSELLGNLRQLELELQDFLTE